MKPTPKQVIAWARETGCMNFGDYGHVTYEFEVEELQQFATLAYEAGRKDENETCAAICDHEMDNAMNFGMSVAAGNCADKIRARREK